MMSKGYYTIIREYYGFPDYLNTDLSKKEDCFAFDTEYEANQCLRDIFENGEWMDIQIKLHSIIIFFIRRYNNAFFIIY